MSTSDSKNPKQNSDETKAKCCLELNHMRTIYRMRGWTKEAETIEQILNDWNSPTVKSQVA